MPYAEAAGSGMIPGSAEAPRRQAGIPAIGLAAAAPTPLWDAFPARIAGSLVPQAGRGSDESMSWDPSESRPLSST